MKFFKSTIILVTLFSCTLLLAQEASKSINLNTSLNSDRENIQELDKEIKELEIKMRALKEKKAELNGLGLSGKVKIFAEDYIQPIMRGEVYDISIGEVAVLADYQKNNPIKCGLKEKETFSKSGCHDRNSYYQWHGEDNFDQESGSILYPFTASYLDASRSLIVPIKIELKKDFQKNLINFLKTSTSGIDYYSYESLPDNMSAEAAKNEYIQCMRPQPNYCKKSLGRHGGQLPGAWGGDSFVINFIDRKQKEVTFYNLKNFREELIRTRKHRFLTNLCSVSTMGNFNGFFDASYRSEEHVQFNDIAVTFYDANYNQIYKLIINTQDATDTHFNVNGIAHKKRNRNFSFTYDYGSNAVNGIRSDHLGYIATIGHLITDTKWDFNRGCKSSYGWWADEPAFSLVSNYEYNLIVELDNNQIQKVSSIEIEYVKGSTSNDLAKVNR